MSINSVTSNSTYYQSILTTNSTGAITNTSIAEATSTATTVSAQTTTTTTNTPTKWGFNVDENGYFGVDFNKAAGLPENMKINQKIMDMASDYSNTVGANVDPLAVVSKVWNMYKSIAGNTFDPNGDGFMTKDEVANMPKGYEQKGGLLDDVISVQKTWDEYYDKTNFGSNLYTVTDCAMCPGYRDFSPAMLGTQFDAGVFFQPSKDGLEASGIKTETSGDDSKISTGEMFSSFFRNTAVGEIDDYKNLKNSQYGTVVDRTNTYYKFLDSGQSIKDWMSENMSQERINYLTQGLGTIDGKFSQSLVDTLFDDLDKEIKEGREEYQANGSATTKSSDNSTLSQISKAYQASTGSNVKLPSGSLISVGA